jgi:outer membrane protein TolC
MTAAYRTMLRGRPGAALWCLVFVLASHAATAQEEAPPPPTLDAAPADTATPAAAPAAEDPAPASSEQPPAVPAAAAEDAAPEDAAPGVAQPTLPEPLTLEHALSLADAAYPGLERARAAVDLARADRRAARAETGINAYIDLTPQTVDPVTTPGHERVDDSRASLVVSKRLFDFGQSRARRAAADAQLAGSELGLIEARALHRIAIMGAFFDVLLADLRYAADNEAMAHRYVRYDKGLTRQELGELSLVDVKELENRYREALNVRNLSEKRQTATRFRLAAMLNLPEQVPAELERPQLTGNEREVPALEELLPVAMKQNTRINQLQRGVEAAELALKAERARRLPVLSAELEAADYEREIGQRESLRGTLNLRIPLYQGGAVTAAVARAAAQLRERGAALRQGEYDLRLALLDQLQEIESLKLQRQSAQVRMDYEDLNLDRAQGNYELEVQTTLGDAMTRLSDAQWLAAKVDFQLALAWARLDAMTGPRPASPK